MGRQNSARSTASDASQSGIDVGRRLYELRKARGYSLRALAEASSLNVNTLCLIENSRTSPSVSTLQQLARTLQVPITVFFEMNQGGANIVFQKNEDRPYATYGHGSIKDLGAGMLQPEIQPFLISLHPGSDSGKNPVSHNGQEFVFNLEGRLTYIIDEISYHLDPGDSIYFDARHPHQWQNLGKTASRNLLVLCASDDHDHPKSWHME